MMTATPALIPALNIVFSVASAQKKIEKRDNYTEPILIELEEAALLGHGLGPAIDAAKRLGYWAAKYYCSHPDHPSRDNFGQLMDCATTALAIALGREMIDEINILYEQISLEVKAMF